MTAKRLRKGLIVQVDFLDHCVCDCDDKTHTPIPCTVFGRIRKLTRESLLIVAWECREKLDQVGGNENSFVILRSTVQRVVVLHE